MLGITLPSFSRLPRPFINRLTRRRNRQKEGPSLAEALDRWEDSSLWAIMTSFLELSNYYQSCHRPFRSTSAKSILALRLGCSNKRLKLFFDSFYSKPDSTCRRLRIDLFPSRDSSATRVRTSHLNKAVMEFSFDPSIFIFFPSSIWPTSQTSPNCSLRQSKTLQSLSTRSILE